MYPATGYNQIDRNQNAPPARKSFMDYNWKLCSLFGIPIHIHMLLPLFFLLTFVFWIQIIISDMGHFWYYLGLITCYNLVLWETVLVHELGHAFAGWLVGGSTDQIILWPLGGLAMTKPPPEPIGQIINAPDKRISRKMANVIIALGGPLTHIPHAIFWGIILYVNGRNQRCYGTYIYNGQTFKDCHRIDNAFTRNTTWSQTIFTPVDHWFDYDFFMLAFTLNVYLFIVNFCLPAYPLDGSKIFVNLLLKYYDQNKTAQAYVAINGAFGAAAVVIGYTLLNGEGMLVFGGLWAFLEAYNMCMLVINSRVFTHPIIASAAS